ncbi:hypothetical protein AWL63_18625 [Sphingomonas panacis]|uniref:Calcium-binding protein n=1 Tax=Sphingomonas panacis TaxID=1560345 RepID=A0A1B3ZDY9_9SPHN|nr:hypothetical protein [Sphingomonas panacis]AOH85653.1 hypothetical protein AWL63_18625 [Sphingomonas panacis]
MTTLTAQQIAILKDIANGGSGGGLYSDTSKPYANSYNYIRSFLGGDAPGEGADVAVWNWLRGAEGVNRSEGQFSAFIRSYTAAQVQIREGRTMQQSELDDASNRIALAVISDIENSGGIIPSLRQIGERDAQQSIRDLPLKDVAIWSGNPLFVLLGDDTFLKENILENTRDSYDFFVMVEAASRALPTINSIPDLFFQLWDLLGIEGMPFTAASAILEINHFISEAYGGQYLSGDVIAALDQRDIWAARQNADGNISLNDDVGIIHAGNGNDSITVFKNAALIDGGSGVDSIEFKTQNALRLVFSDQSSAVPFSGLVFEEGGGFNPGGLFDFKRASLYDIEKNQADRT